MGASRLSAQRCGTRAGGFRAAPSGSANSAIPRNQPPTSRCSGTNFEACSTSNSRFLQRSRLPKKQVQKQMETYLLTSLVLRAWLPPKLLRSSSLLRRSRFFFLSSRCTGNVSFPSAKLRRGSLARWCTATLLRSNQPGPAPKLPRGRVPESVRFAAPRVAVRSLASATSEQASEPLSGSGWPRSVSQPPSQAADGLCCLPCERRSSRCWSQVLTAAGEPAGRT